MIISQPSLWLKLQGLETDIHQALLSQSSVSIPEVPARDVLYLPVSRLPRRQGLSQKLGQQRLLHDLANIELQAMELCLRTLWEFPRASKSLRDELAGIAIEEGRHLRLCVEALESLGGHWGQFPVHLGLWHATHAKDTLLQRLMIVHRYLEASGLDAGDSLLRKLSGVKNPVLRQTVKTIVDDEVAHVAFGSRWYHQLCKEQGVDAEAFYKNICQRLMHQHPRRDRLSYELRRQAKYTQEELQMLEELRAEI